jgi:hypothetical protein
MCAGSESVVVRCLTNQLDLAISLLRNATVREGEDEVIKTAREAYRHSLGVLNRLHRLPPTDLDAIHARLHEFRETLAQIR